MLFYLNNNFNDNIIYTKKVPKLNIYSAINIENV